MKQLKDQGQDLSAEEMHAILPPSVSRQATLLAQVASEAMRQTPCVVCYGRSVAPAAVVLPWAVSDKVGGSQNVSRLILYFLCRKHAELAWTDLMDEVITAVVLAHAEEIRTARPVVM